MFVCVTFLFYGLVVQCQKRSAISRGTRSAFGLARNQNRESRSSPTLLKAWAAEEGGTEGAAVPLSHGAGGGANISFPPPRNFEGAPRKICVENVRNSMTPNITLVETGQVRKIGALRLQRGPRRFRGPRKLVCPPPNWFAP